ncbi:acyl-CoA Delta(11) desaturase-like isoform X1 [Cimex lectularius]|uniref:Fatty acid desaturase domain-containing protein n=2 Tax=Cimex lectularius TaxID=79782 RepID=A0A8I6S3N4_CIMLE|nr:acyl-CoA Delta(11) desaturase-like isoform X1 [Cimex lectularius]
MSRRFERAAVVTEVLDIQTDILRTCNGSTKIRMAPNLSGATTGLFLTEAEVISKTPTTTQEPTKPQYEWKIVWRNVLAFAYLHIGAFYGLYLLFTQALAQTILFTVVLIYLGGMGVTAGSHRLWSHKSYKAKWPLRLMLAIFQTLAFQNHIYEWVRDHRVHHKFTDTDADPHNSKRGFFFSHMGWLVIKKHKDVMNKGKTVDMSDLEQDWVVMFQKKTYAVLLPLICFILPTFIPVYYWDEKPWTAWYVAAIARYTLSLHGTWLVNSAAHMYGTRPYDRTISPRENLSVAILAFGEGWHNYHHAFPWDYKTSEFSGYSTNFTTAFIDFFSKIGWAYDLKTASIEMVKKRAARTGDGGYESAKRSDHTHDGEVWGWDDKDMTQEEKNMVLITNQKED